MHGEQHQDAEDTCLNNHTSTSTLHEGLVNNHASTTTLHEGLEGNDRPQSPPHPAAAGDEIASLEVHWLGGDSAIELPGAHGDSEKNDASLIVARKGYDDGIETDGSDATTANTANKSSGSSTGTGTGKDDPAHLEEARAEEWPAPTASELTFPEGGLEAWLVVFGCFCTMVCIYGMINAAGVLQSYLASHQLAAYSASQIGWLFSLYLFIVFFVGIQVGPVFDRYGARALVAAGTLLVVLSLMLLSLSTTYAPMLLTYSFTGGLGGALLNTPAYGCIAHFFDRRRAFATGVASTGSGLGGVVFPLVMRRLLPTAGFGWTCRVLGFVMFGLAVPANLFVRTRLVPSSSPPPSPLPSSGLVLGAGSGSGIGRRCGGILRQWRSVLPDPSLLKEPRLAIVTVGCFFMEWGLFTPDTYMASYAEAYGESTDQSYLLISYCNAGSVVGRVVPGLIADRFGRFNTIVVTIGLCAATTLGVWLPAKTSEGANIAFAVLFGVASGSNLTLSPVCLGQLCDAREFGRVMTTVMLVASFGTLTGPPIAGALLRIGGGGDTGWEALVLFSGLSYAAALVCFVWARILAVGWDPRTKF